MYSKIDLLNLPLILVSAVTRQSLVLYFKRYLLNVGLLFILPAVVSATPLEPSIAPILSSNASTISITTSITHSANTEAANTYTHINILVIPAVLENLTDFLQGQDIEKINNFDRPNARRDLIDYVLLRQALYLGKTKNQHISITVTPWLNASYSRMIKNLKNGQYTVFANTVWREDFPMILNTQIQQKKSQANRSHSNSSGSNPLQPNPSSSNIAHAHQLYISNPTMRYGEFEAGLYMNPSNPKFPASGSPLDISQFTVISSKQWRPDWLALSQLPFKHMYNEVHWEHMFKMVYSQRADAMLIAFSQEADFNITLLNMTLLPIPNVKVALAGSRGWAISRSHPSGTLTYEILERGLQILRRKGIIPRAYFEADVINSRVKYWRTLNDY